MMQITISFLLISCLVSGVQNEVVKQDKIVNEVILKQLNNSLRNVAEFENFKAGDLVLITEGTKNKIIIEGSYFLKSKNRDERKQFLEKINKNALDALKNAYEKKQIKLEINEIDTSALINSSDDDGEQARQVILKKVLVGNLNESMIYNVKTKKTDNSLEFTLEGFVTKASYRGLVTDESLKILKKYKEKGIVNFDVSNVISSNLKNYPNIIVYEIMRNLENSPEVSVNSLELFHAEIDDKQTCLVVGLFKDSIQLEKFKMICLKAITNSYELESNYTFREKVQKPLDLNSSFMKIGLSWDSRSKLFEDFMAFKKIENIKIQSFDKLSGSISLCGVASSESNSKFFIEFLERMSLVKIVDSKNLFAKSKRNFGRDTDILYGDCVLALTNNLPDEVLRLSAIIIQQGGADNHISANAWFLRAAAHLMLGDEKNALGDLKIGDLLLGDYSFTLERFQGSLRTKLTELRKADKNLFLN